MWPLFYSILHDILNAILIGVGGITLAYLITRLSSRALSRWISPNWSRIVSSLIGLGILIWTIRMILDSTGAQGLVVVLVTATTTALALGSSRVMEDLVAGISLFFATPYEVGDRVTLGGYNGKVTSISLFLTIIENDNGDRIYIRNSEVTRTSIVKYAASQVVKN